jgi:hypothetical protein
MRISKSQAESLENIVRLFNLAIKSGQFQCKEGIDGLTMALDALGIDWYIDDSVFRISEASIDK